MFTSNVEKSIRGSMNSKHFSVAPSKKDAVRRHIHFIVAIPMTVTFFGCTKEPNSGRIYQKL